jgi:uncharacterized RmlC-like cupin family protein
MLGSLRRRIVIGKDVDFKDLGSLSAERGRKGDAYLEDELYYVVKGKARMRAGAEDRSLEPGHIVFVAAHVEHRFYDIAEELTVLVFFAPAETS